MKPWKVRELVTEAGRNLAASWPRTLVTSLAVAAMVGGLTWSELDTTQGILGFHRGFVAAGGNVVVVSHPQGVPAGKCIALAARPEVLASGAHQSGEIHHTDIAPGTLIQTAEITAGVLAVWSPDLRRAETALASGIAIGRAAADELGRVDGMRLGYGDLPPSPVLVVDVERRNPQGARTLYAPIAPVGEVGSCWYEMAPGAASAGIDLGEHVFAAAGPDLAVRPWTRLDEFARDPITELATRPQASAWAAAGTLLTLLMWLALWFRRGELSLYRILGTSRPGLWLLTHAETVAVLAVAGLIGYLWAAAAYVAVTGHQPTPDQYRIAARTAVSAAALTAVAAPLASLLTGARKALLDQLKER